jgi:hypothetical protein
VGYRECYGNSLEAPTAEGMVRLEVALRDIKVSIKNRTLHVIDDLATVFEHKRNKVKRESFRIEGRLVVARDVPHEDLGVWIELPGGMRRIFGVEPVSLLEPQGLDALAGLDRFALGLRTALADYQKDICRAVEIGRGLDKVLLADHGDRFVVYARRLFRDRARFALVIHDDGRIVIPGKKPVEVNVRSKFGVTVVGDYIRFAAPDGTDLARISIPWIAPEDRYELARRIGQLIDATPVGSLPDQIYAYA